MAAAALTVGCEGSDASGPASLADGSQPVRLPIELRGVEKPAVLTRVRLRRLADIERGGAVAACIEDWGIRPLGEIVVRVGVTGESVTFRGRARRSLYGCDNGEGPGEEGRRWCGRAFGQLGRRLRDPRLDLGPCRTGDGAELGFAWIEPDPTTRYVVVEQPGYVEVYSVAGGLPVRVTTTAVEIERSRAEFDVSESGTDGNLIRSYRLVTAVAG